jgi:hypothetical protein
MVPAESLVMNTLDLEDIDSMRLQLGVDDVELRDRIRQLVAGDCVRLTFLSTIKGNHTLMVRITSMKNGAFRGRLLHVPVKMVPDGLRVGILIPFAAEHIHSIVRAKIWDATLP